MHRDQVHIADTPPQELYLIQHQIHTRDGLAFVEGQTEIKQLKSSWRSSHSIAIDDHI